MTKTCKVCLLTKPTSEFEQWKLTCRECRRLYDRERNKLPEVKARHAAWDRAKLLRRKYGLTTSEYDQMVADRRGMCDACGRVPQKKLVIDHDHNTGAVCGLLCDQCNIAAGYLQDSPSRARALADYLEARKAQMRIPAVKLVPHPVRPKKTTSKTS